jgi:cold shock CspA family protein
MSHIFVYRHLVRNKSDLSLGSKVKGRVKFFDVTKGYGFITPNDGSSDVFVHQSNIHAKGFRSLGEGEDVEFDLESDPQRGKSYAVNVTGPNGEYVIGSNLNRRSDRFDADEF